MAIRRPLFLSEVYMASLLYDIFAFDGSDFIEEFDCVIFWVNKQDVRTSEPIHVDCPIGDENLADCVN